VGDCKSLKIKNTRHIHNHKKYEGFGGRLPVGGREAWGPGPLGPP